MADERSDDNHEAWFELGAGFVMSSLDDADQVAFLEHVGSCARCQDMQREFAEVLAELAYAEPAIAPPASLKASIMRAVVADGEQSAPVTSIAAHSSSVGGGVFGRTPLWLRAAAAAVIVVAAVGGIVLASTHKVASVAARCAKVNCPIVPLMANGQDVGAVMVFDNAAYVQANGLPATPSGDSYVLWWTASGQPPVGVAAVRTTPKSGPVKVGKFTTQIGVISGFALSEEPGKTVPAAPSKVLARGSLD